MTAEDDDAGVNGELEFSIVYIEHSEDKYFEVRKLSDEVAELRSDVVFDRERPERGSVTIQGKVTYLVTVKAEDDGTPPLSTNCFFFVTILDENDNVPRFDGSASDVRTKSFKSHTQ